MMTPVFRAKSTAAFDGLYQRNAPTVYRYAYAVLGNHPDAEDVTQQTFLNAYRAISQGTKPRKAENWLLTIAHNELRRHFRSTKGKSLEVALDEQLAPAAPEHSDLTFMDVLRALQHLPPSQRSALVMREFEGRSYAEIAEILGVTQSALEALIFRARRSLAEELEEGLTCAEAERALSLRIDGRLPRRAARGLKAHMRECPQCARFERLQKRQRSLLKGLSVMPVPVSLFLFRGESAAAGGSVTAGAGGAAAGAGTAGIASGLFAKAAAVTAAAAVAGGVGYEVAAGPDPVTKAERKATHAVAVAQTRGGGRAADVAAARSGGEQPGPARPARAGERSRAGGSAALRPNAANAGWPQKPGKSEKAKDGSPGAAAAGRRAVLPAEARRAGPHPATKPAKATPRASNARPRPRAGRPAKPERSRPTTAAKPLPLPKERPPVARSGAPPVPVPPVVPENARKP